MNLLSISCQQTSKKSENGGKRANPRTPLPRLRKNLFYYCDTTFYRCQRNARPNITVTVSVRVSVTVRRSCYLMPSTPQRHQRPQATSKKLPTAAM